jgi:hypothetical protein
MSLARIKLALQAVAGLFAFALYVWFAAVRALPRIHARKAARRAARARTH